MELGKNSRPMSIKELANATGIPASSIYRILRPLEQVNLIQRNDLGERFLGLAVFELVSSAHDIYGYDVVEIAKPFMKSLSDATQETILLTVLLGSEILCLETIPSPKVVRLSPQRGRLQSPVDGCSSKALVAFLPKETLDQLIEKRHGHKRIDGTYVTPDLLRQEFAEIRRLGYSVTIGEVDEGASGIAVPIILKSGEVRAALAILGPENRINEAELDEYKNLLLTHSERIAQRLSLAESFVSS